jgi:hypothetical protein
LHQRRSPSSRHHRPSHPCFIFSFSSRIMASVGNNAHVGDRSSAKIPDDAVRTAAPPSPIRRRSVPFIHPSFLQTATAYVLVLAYRLRLSRPVFHLRGVSSAHRHHAYTYLEAKLHYNVFRRMHSSAIQARLLIGCITPENPQKPRRASSHSTHIRHCSTLPTPRVHTVDPTLFSEQFVKERCIPRFTHT